MGTKRPTAKDRVRKRLREKRVVDELVALRGKDDPPDEDGLTPRHWAVLRARGVDRKSYREIATKLDVSVATVSRLLTDALERMDKLQKESLERIRTMDLAALDEMQAVFTPLMRAGEKAAADVVLRVIARRGKVTGYTPKESAEIPAGEIDVPTWTCLDADEPLKELDAEIDAELARALGRDDDRPGLTDKLKKGDGDA